MCVTGWSTIASRASRATAHRFARWRGAAGEERGASVLEMAFIAMFVFVLVAGIVDLGGAYHDHIILINSSREGARLYSRMPCTSSTRGGMKTAVINAAIGEATKTKDGKLMNELELTAANVSIQPDGRCPAPNETVSVTVRIDYKTMMGPFWGATTFPISARTSMMFYGAD